MVKKGAHRGSVKDGGTVGADAWRKATAPRRQPPHGVEGERWRQSPSLTPRPGRRQSPSAIALFLSKKRKGKLVRREAPGLPRARRVPNATSSRCNRLGSVVLTLGELRRITKNFSDDQLVGEGAFGKVYKGVLANGDMIAVKRFASTITGLQDVHYENEAQHLMSLKHPNIVQLVGYCSETEMKLVRYNGKFVRAEQSERLLCLKYMPKGSLRGHLSDETSGLEWNTRYKIIEAICYGLHYLHEEWQATPIIHMDLKPANILLDDNMVPKIADFGISRLFAEEQTRTCTKNCKGTPGYMPPEYIEKGVITKKYDIFSLGVLIIEIITGVKDYPTKETETTFQQYIDLVLNNWRPRLRKAQGYTSQDIDYQQIKKCIQIGLLCVQFDPVERPTINQIIKMLQKSDEAKATSRCNRLGSIILTLGELRQITNNFSDDQLLGEGACGKVYKGVLTNGDMIAVKRFASTITGLQDAQYENEAQHLMSLKHPNIVQLVGYCSDTQMKLVRHNGKFVRAEQSERLLCLQYMPKGSLRGHLSDETSGLEWYTRYKIIEGICYGLHYLHEEWQVTPIIHMDLKPANILLDDNLVPKIADFGLSRLFGEEQTRTCTTSCKGTPGYMAPEYLEKGVITKKFDIFSLGVIIIEIITGLKSYPTDETETTTQQYIDLVLNNWRYRLRKTQGYIYRDIDYQQIKKCIQIGLLCVKFDPVKRPTIYQIIKMLERSDEAYQYIHIDHEMQNIFEENNQLINSIEVNILTSQAHNNIALFHHTRRNINGLLQSTSQIPGIMNQMPPLPVSVNERLATYLLPLDPMSCDSYSGRRGGTPRGAMMRETYMGVLPPVDHIAAWKNNNAAVRLWTAEENKLFESALAGLDLGCPEWEKVARAIPGRMVHEVVSHFKNLQLDVHELNQ